MTARSETLAEWLAKHQGQVVQIGTKHGAGFIFAGRAGAETLEEMRRAYHCPFNDFEVLDVYPSAYVGYIVIIPGALSGKEELPRALLPKRGPVPMENYRRFADVLLGHVVQSYKTALYAEAIGGATTATGSEILQCEKFIRSEVFGILSQSADGEEIIRLVKKQVEKEANARQRSKKTNIRVS